MSEGARYSVAGSAESFGGASLVDFAYHHPSPLCALLCFCKWGKCSPMSIFLWPAKASPWHGGLLQFWVVLMF